VILLVCGATLLAVCAWDRDWRWLGRLRPLSGIALTLAIVLPWMIAIGIETQGAFYEKSLGQDFAMKLAGGQETHGAPPGYYTLLAPVTFWPATLLLLPGLVFAVRRHRDPAMRFLLAWAAATWLMFEIAPTKLPHYVLPAYPVFAIFAALWLTQAKSASVSASRWDYWPFRVSLVLFGVVGLALAGLFLWAPPHYGTGLNAMFYGLPVVAAAFVIAAVVAGFRGFRLAATASAVLSALCLYGFVGIAAPTLDRLWLSPRLAQAVVHEWRENDPPVVLAGYSEPSALFLMGTNTELASGAAAGETLSARGGLAIVEQSQKAAFLDALNGNAKADALEEVDGLNYSNGRQLRLQLYRVTPAK
jgi:4-amino-4-deoxy-L-arabinose transferase-like glycosyltransferase